MNVNWAIIGTDDKALDFAKKIKNSLSGRLKAIASTNTYESFRFAKAAGSASYYGDFVSILKDENINSVYITQIDPSNYELIIKLIQAGKSVVYDNIFMSTDKMEKLISSTYNKATFFAKKGLNEATVVNF